MGQIQIGAQTLTVYGDQPGLRDYWAAMPNGTAVTNADSGLQKQSLVGAQRWLDSLGLCDPETGADIIPTADDIGVPADVITGAYEAAKVLILDPNAADNQNTSSNIKQAGAGSTAVTFFRFSNGTILPTAAFRYLKPYLKSQQGGTGLFGGASGTGDKSSFCDPSAPGLNRGWP